MLVRGFRKLAIEHKRIFYPHIVGALLSHYRGLSSDSLVQPQGTIKASKPPAVAPIITTDASPTNNEMKEPSLIKSNIQERIKKGMVSGDFEGILSAFQDAKSQQLELDSEDYNLVLMACTKVKGTSRVISLTKAAYSFFERSQIIPLEVFNK